MDRFCKLFNMDINSKCIEYFRKVLAHCSRLFSTHETDKFDFALFQHKYVVDSDELPIKLSQISINDCYKFTSSMLTIFEENMEYYSYVGGFPLFVIEILTLLMIIIWGIFVYIDFKIGKDIFIYEIWGKKKYDPLKKQLDQLKRKVAIDAVQSLELVKYETRYLKMNYFLPIYDILRHDDIPTLIIRISSELEHKQAGVVKRNITGNARCYRFLKMEETFVKHKGTDKKSDIKKANIKKVIQFANNSERAMLLTVYFEKQEDFTDFMRILKDRLTTNPNITPKSKTLFINKWINY